MNYYTKSIEETFKDLTSSSEGLTQAEADLRKVAYGKNELTQPPKATV